jgi:iron(III) transport system substrate-binding protein
MAEGWDMTGSQRSGPDRRGFLKLAGATVGVAAVGGVIAGCSSDSKSDAGGSGGSTKSIAGSSITIYTAANVDVMKLMTAQFEQETGVKAQVYRDSSGLIAQRFLKEQQASQRVCDVLEVGDYVFLDDMGKRGYFVDISDYPGVADIPADWKRLPYVVTENTQAQNVCYNTQLVSSDLVPKEWPDLLNPAFKGKIAMADPRNNIATTGAFLLAIVSKYGWEWLEGMGKQNIQFSPTAPPAIGKVASGDAMFAMPTLAQNLVTYAQKDAPIQIVSPPMGPTSVNPRALAIPKNAPNPEAARAWCKYVTGVDGQATMNVYKDISIGVSPLGTAKVPGSVADFPPGFIVAPDAKEAQKQINKISDLLNVH